jgi:ribosomal protein L11 methyltransferase
LLIQTCRERHVGSLLDVGCGSGILSLVGAVLGVPFAVGCDLNLAAIQVSRNNARQFQMPGRVFWIHGSTEALKSPFHLVVANLPFTVQMAKREEFGRLVHPRGGLILSGFRDTREKDLTDYYLSRGWRLQRRLTKDRWELELPEDRSYTWVGLYFAV